MDEILIEEKKYISSKRAAKITGYAKDYIGQLCREGRVPARLVGRSWYVLESAIQDHRFGNPEVNPQEAEKDTPNTTLHPTWEAPRYEAVSEEVLPSINRPQTSSESVRDSWQTWSDYFDRMKENSVQEETVQETGQETEYEDAVQEIVPNEDANEGEDTNGDTNEDAKEEQQNEPEEENREEVNIPIHTMYKPLPDEFLPHSAISISRQENKDAKNTKQLIQRKNKKGLFMKVLQAIVVMFAVIVAAVAIIGSGHFDRYISSVSQASSITGIVLYNK